MKTKDRILAAALRLFNEQGVSNVSSRTVSDDLQISYGNLTYYFPKKEDIIYQLYMNMQAELDQQFSKLRQEIFQFDFMVRSLRGTLEVLHSYRFVFLDLTYLTRKFPKIKAHAVRQYHSRQEIGKQIFGFLMREGYLKEEKVEGHYDMLVHNVVMILNLWIMDSEIYYRGSESAKVDHYLELIYSFVRASLTKKGADAFMDVYREFQPPSSRLSGVSQD
ncbi:MAG: TetR/AcrR family transcriptional regulator [Bacteroidota bacterium]